MIFKHDEACELFITVPGDEGFVSPVIPEYPATNTEEYSMTNLGADHNTCEDVSQPACLWWGRSTWHAKPRGWHSHSDDLRDTVNDLEAPNIEVEEGPEVTSAKLEETKSNEKDIKNCFEFENFETPDSIDFSGDSIEKTKVKMVSDSKSVANTDVQAGQALQLTIVLIYLNNNTRGKMLKNLNARMDGGDLLTLKGAETEARLLGEKLYSNQEDSPNCDMIQCYADFASPDGVEQDKQISSDITDKEDKAENSKSISSPVLVQNMSVLYHQAGQCGPVVLREDPCWQLRGGECPLCGYENTRGDQCDASGKLIIEW